MVDISLLYSIGSIMESMCFQFSCVFHLSTFICHDPRLASREHLLLHPDILWGNTWKKTVSFPGKLKAIDIGHAFFYGRFRYRAFPTRQTQKDLEAANMLRSRLHGSEPPWRGVGDVLPWITGGGFNMFWFVLIMIQTIYIYIIILYIYVYPLVI